MWTTFFITVFVIIATLAAFLLALAEKWGIIEWLQLHAPSDFLHRLFSCPFCLSWWTCLALSVVAFALSGDYVALTTAPCATMITRSLWTYRR